MAQQRWTVWIATGMGSGNLPAAPGTVGSLVGAGAVMLLWGSSPAIHLAAWAVLLGIGVYTAGEAQEILGGKDSPRIVIDEIQGMVLAAFLLPQTVSWVIAAFLLFRVLDILKPPPAGWCERRLPGGWGVMLDDTVAGLYANLLLLGGHWWIK